MKSGRSSPAGTPRPSSAGRRAPGGASYSVDEIVSAAFIKVIGKDPCNGGGWRLLAREQGEAHATAFQSRDRDMASARIEARREARKPAWHAEAVKLCRQGVRVQRIAETFGVSDNAVYVVLKAHGGVKALRT